MLFPTMIFLLFFLVVYAAAWSLERQNANRKFFLVLASWVFYGWWDWRFVGLLILSAFFNWWIAATIVKTQRRLGAQMAHRARRGDEPERCSPSSNTMTSSPPS